MCNLPEYQHKWSFTIWLCRWLEWEFQLGNPGLGSVSTLTDWLVMLKPYSEGSGDPIWLDYYYYHLLENGFEDHMIAEAGSMICYT